METLQRTANRGSVSSALYSVANSVKLDKGNDTTTVEFFERTVSSAGSRTIGTFSAWIKKTDVTTAQYLFTFGNTDNDNGRTFARFQTDGTLRIGGGQTTWRNTNRVFRDTSAWYHIVIAFDTTQSTANDRFKLYVNGVQETSFSTTNNPSEDDLLGLNFEKQAIGYNTIDNGSGFNGYMCEVVIQDGVASAPTEFGEFDSASGIWIPKDASGATMGTNGTYLKFENAASMGAATAGNAFTVQNINQVDQAIDTCTNNYPVMNILYKYPSSQVFSQGNTKLTRSSGSGLNKTFLSTIALTSGKWYAEFKPKANSSNYVIGIMPLTTAASVALDGNHLGNSSFTGSLGYYSPDGSMLANGNSANGSFGASYTANDIIGVALDMTNRKVYFSKNGTFQNSQDPTDGTNAITLTNTTEGYFIGFTYDTGGEVEANFGGYHANTLASAQTDGNGFGDFEHAPPSGYLACATKNLAETGG